MSSQGITYPINIITNGNRELPKLARNADKADVSLNKMTRDANGRLRDVNGRFIKTTQSSNTLGNSVVGLGSKSQRGLGLMERKARGAGHAMGKLRGIAAGLGLMLSTGAIAAGLVGTGAGFEKSMSNVKALAGASETQMVSLTKAARNAGATTAYSAKEAADAMGYLAQAGYKADQQIEALPATLSLAAAGGLDLARSADIATNILSQYRMQASDTDVVVDQLALTQSSFNTNIEEMSDAMNYWGPSAAAMKIGLSESNAVIGLLANNGLKGSLATRALGTSIVRLNNPTGAMKSQMADLNLQLHDSKGQFVGVASMIEQMNRATSNMPDKQKQAAISTIFGNEAIQEMNILMAEGADKIRYWTGELDNAQGAAKKMADTKLDNLAGDFKILQSTAQETSLQLYEKMGPALRLLTQEATEFVRSLDTEEVGLMLKDTVMGIRKGLMWFRKHKDTIVGLGKAMIILKVATLAYNKGAKIQAALMGVGRTAVGLFTAGTNGAASSMRTFNSVVKANPLGLLLTAITAAAGAWLLFRDNAKKATAAQRELSAEELLARKDAATLIKDTDADLKKIEIGLNARQLREVLGSARTRLGKTEDMKLDMRSHLKTSPLYSEYNELKRKKDAADYSTDEDGKIRSPGLTRDEIIRFEAVKKELNSIPTQLYGVTLGAINSTITKNKKLLKEATLRIKKLPKGEREGILGTGTDGVIDSTESSKNIISGGASQRIVNVQIDKFQDNINFNIQGEIEALRNSVDEMREIVNGQFMRILNSANQLANG